MRAGEGKREREREGRKERGLARDAERKSWPKAGGQAEKSPRGNFLPEMEIPVYFDLGWRI